MKFIPFLVFSASLLLSLLMLCLVCNMRPCYHASVLSFVICMSWNKFHEVHSMLSIY